MTTGWIDFRARWWFPGEPNLWTKTLAWFMIHVSGFSFFCNMVE